MKHLRWLYLGTAVFLCVCLLSPLNADAASARKAQPKNQKSLAKTDSKKAVKAVKGKNSQKSASRAGNKSSRKTADAERARHNGKSRAKAPETGADRDVWLKRARESELFAGKASWYGRDFHNKATASGLDYDMYTFTAAHRTLPLGTVVKVTDQHNGKSVMVCVTDRGPYVRGRIIDLSYAAAKQLGLNKRGVGRVNLEVVSDEKGAPLKADEAYFISYGPKKRQNKVGPFHAFADAAAMHEALRQAHPDAEVVLEKSGGKR